MVIIYSHQTQILVPSIHIHFIIGLELQAHVVLKYNYINMHNIYIYIILYNARI